jgi:hypothetical protein
MFMVSLDFPAGGLLGIDLQIRVFFQDSLVLAASQEVSKPMGSGQLLKIFFGLPRGQKPLNRCI